MSDLLQDQEPSSDAGQQENWFLLMDPEWEPDAGDEVPPIESIMGLWPVDPDGKIEYFRSNPDYRPVSAGSPTDPLDAVLRQLDSGTAKPELLQLLLRDIEFDLAMNGDGRPLILPLEEGEPCAVLATAESQRELVPSPMWVRITLEDLVDLLEDGTDVWCNPGGSTPARLAGDFVRAAHAMTEDETEALYGELDEARGELEIIRWDLDAPGPPSGLVDDAAGDSGGGSP